MFERLVCRSCVRQVFIFVFLLPAVKMASQHKGNKAKKVAKAPKHQVTKGAKLKRKLPRKLPRSNEGVSRAWLAKVKKLQYHYSEIEKIVREEKPRWRQLPVSTPEISWVVPDIVLEAGHEPGLAYTLNGVEYNTKNNNEWVGWVPSYNHKLKTPITSADP